MKKKEGERMRESVSGRSEEQRERGGGEEGDGERERVRKTKERVGERGKKEKLRDKKLH